MTIAALRALAEFETKKHGPKCQRHGSDIVLALLDVAEAAEACAPMAARDVRAVYAPEVRRLRAALDRLGLTVPNEHGIT